MDTYVITGGTGKTGKKISTGLLESGNVVRVICRHPEKAKELREKGAQIFTGDSRDENFLKRAFIGCKAIYVVLPIDMQATHYTDTQVAHATAIRNAAVSSGIKYAVTLSSVGGQLNRGNGVVLGLHKMEELFNEAPNMHIKHLRATYFMENTLRQIPLIQQKNMMAGPEKGDVEFAMVASKDIAAVALNHLRSLNFSGKSVDYVLGERDISYNEIATIYGRAIGKPNLLYTQLPKEVFITNLLKMRASESAANKFYEFTRLINEGKVSQFYHRTAENSTSTSIEDFTEIFKRNFEKQM